MTRPKVLILHAPGTNRDSDAKAAFELAGADPEVVPLALLRAGDRRMADYQILMLPGGFSYADALGAGRLLALDLQSYFAEQVGAFVASGKPVLGVCNGFQALVKAGLLPERRATLTFNAQGSFECRWVTLLPRPGSLWTDGLKEPIECPVAHGEGNFQLAEPGPVDIAFVYAGPSEREPAHGEYPFNPNGSLDDIAGVTNARGNVLGLMPHPEDHLHPWQHPLHPSGYSGGSGLPLFRAGVAACR